jgi:hypothetical protein
VAGTASAASPIAWTLPSATSTVPLSIRPPAPSNTVAPTMATGSPG